jgi:hypothetical protein
MEKNSLDEHQNFDRIAIAQTAKISCFQKTTKLKRKI